jgi:hypothetical protein
LNNTIRNRSIMIDDEKVIRNLWMKSIKFTVIFFQMI